MPMLLERTVVYIYVVLFAISILLEQSVPLGDRVLKAPSTARDALG